MGYKEKIRPFNLAQEHLIFQICLVSHALTCAGLEGFFIRRSSLCMLTQYTKRIAPFLLWCKHATPVPSWAGSGVSPCMWYSLGLPKWHTGHPSFYVFFAAVFLSVIKEHEINRSRGVSPAMFITRQLANQCTTNYVLKRLKQY